VNAVDETESLTSRTTIC